MNAVRVLALFAQVAALGAVAFAGARAARGLRFRDDEWPEWSVAAAVLALAGASVLVIALGAVGALRPLPLALGAFALAAVAWRATRGLPRRPPLPAIPRAQGLCLALAAGIATPFAVRALVRVPLSWDALTYHLVKSARWIESGRLELLTWPDPFHLVGFYPGGGSAWFAFAMGIVRNDVLVSLPNLPLLALGALALGAIARRLGASAPAAVAAGLLYLALPIVLNFAASPWVEPLLNLALFAAVLLAMRAVAAPVETLAAHGVALGAALGLACGTKFTALYLAAAIAVWLPLDLARRVGPAAAARCTAWLGATALAVGGWWYAANALATGNPFYPTTLAFLRGVALPEAFWGEPLLAQLPALWSPAFRHAWVAPAGEPWTMGQASPGLLALGALGLGAAGVRAVERLRSARDSAPALFLVLALVSTLAYLTIPTATDAGAALRFSSPQVLLRFAVPPLALAVAAGMAALSRWRVPDWTFPLLVALAFWLALPNLDLSLPGATLGQSVLAMGAVALASAPFLAGLVPARATRAAAALAALALVLALPLLLRSREQARAGQLRTGFEMTVPVQRFFAPVAAVLEREHPGRPLAVSAAPRLDFLYLFAGRWLDRPLLYVETHGGAPGTQHHPDGDSRREPDRSAWLANLRRSPAELLLVLRRASDDALAPEEAVARGALLAWPVEARWARELGLTVLYEDPFAALFDLAPLRAGAAP